MKINVQQFEKVIDSFRYGALHTSCKDAEVELDISIREESMDEGRLMSCVMLTISGKKEASSYDSIKTEKVFETTIEIFPDHENRPPRISTKESRDMF